MIKLKEDIKGAVTVFITLLLIPAMLVSGTAVDLARIHTAHSTISNANQLAANSMLTAYNALLYDIYGLFGLAQDDPILLSLLDEYISVSVFGQSTQDKSLGTLQLFYGSNIRLDEPEFSEGKNLRTEDVLRRQIEEYMKFRGPVIIVKELIEKLSSTNIKTDSKLINDKIEIDKAIAELFQMYKELYEAIVAADRCNQAIGGIAGGSFGNMSGILTNIYDNISSMASIAQAYMYEECADEALALESAFNAHRQNVGVFTTGGTRLNSQGNSVGNINVGLIMAIENSKTQADNFKPKFDLIVTLSKEIDEKKQYLSNKLEQFEQQLLSAEASQELREAFTTAQGDPAISILDRYKNIIKWELEDMAIAYQESGYSYIDEIHKPMLDTVRYRDRLNSSGATLSLDELSGFSHSAAYTIHNAGALERLSGFSRDNVTYKMEPGFIKYGEISETHRAFYDELELMMKQPQVEPTKLFEGQEDSDGEDAEEQQRGLISQLYSLVQTAYNGLKNDPLGAKYISVPTSLSSNQEDLSDINDLMTAATKSPTVDVLDNPISTFSAIGDYALLLVYATEMFSGYSSSKPDSIGKSADELSSITFEKTVSGVPKSPEVNYFFQSELEYLYNGSLDAKENLSAITRLILLTRLVCNYIRVFSVPEINVIVNSIKAAFSWSPPLSIILGELARGAFVLAESVVDVVALRTGHKVPLLKNTAAGEWICTPKGIILAARKIVESGTVDGFGFKNERGFTYENFIVFFLIAKAVFNKGGDEDAGFVLSKRIGDLIEWNIINYESKSNADEAQMADALNRPNRFKLEEMKTDFSLTTCVELRMLFLSMVFSQNFSNSRNLGMSGQMEIRVTEHRGY